MIISIQIGLREARSLLFKFLSVFMVLVLALPPSRVLALSGCSATVTPSVANAGDSNTATFEITNDDGSANINWIHVQRPSEFFWISGASDSGWSVAGDSSELYFNGGSLALGQSLTVEISFTTDVKNISSQDWLISASDTGDATGASVCSGSHSSSISGHPDNSASNGVDSVLGTGNGTSATITWNSDYPTSSYVYYGTTSSYGSVSSYDTSQVQDHSIVLTGLSPETGYHFQVAGTDSSGSSVWSADSTFISDGSSGGGGSGGGGSGTGGSGADNNQSNTDTPAVALIFTKDPSSAPPTVVINTVFTGTYKTAPLISGSAVGPVAIKKIEYSTDNAKNWLPADSVAGIGTTKANFSFTAVNLKDGNYSIAVRATDNVGNSSIVFSKTFVIDLLPPIVGTASVHIGTQAFMPNQQGIYSLVEGTDTQITISAIGGPSSIYLEAQKTGDAKTAYTFSMKRSADTGLWSGIASFTTPGVYTLQANATDGALNKTTRLIGIVNVQSTGVVADVATQQPISSTISVYFLDPETNTMELWDSESSSQDNPLKTKDGGRYSIYLPAGTYYLKVTAPNYKTVNSNIFSVDQLTNITESIQLHKKPGLHIAGKVLSFPWVSFKQTQIDLTIPTMEVDKEPTIQRLPEFSLDLTNGKKLSTVDLYAKPTVISFISTWSDAGRDQLSLLSSASQEYINVVPVASGESLARLRAYVALGGYEVPVLVDTNNKLVQDFGVSNVPTHYFINRRGMVTSTLSGVMTLEELMANVIN